MKVTIKQILYPLGITALSVFFIFSLVTLVIAIVGWNTIDVIYNGNGTINLHIPVTDKDRQSIHFFDSQIWPWFDIAPFGYIALLVYIILFTKFDTSNIRSIFKHKPKEDNVP